jgi:hypothetical protein
MTINTGGVDVSQQTGGVGHQPGHQERHRPVQGLGPFLRDQRPLRANNITDAMRTQGATSGNPIQDVKDFGVEMGGPIKKGKRVDVGQLRQERHQRRRARLLPADASCQAIKSTPLTSRDIEDVNDC